MRILGIDPGLGITGYGVVESSGVTDSSPEKVLFIDAGCIRPGGPSLPLPARLRELEADLSILVDRVKPNWMCVESLFAHYRHPRTSITMAHARGVILLVGQRHGIDVLEIPPTEAKKSLTGSGRATKAQVQHAVTAMLDLAEPPEPVDVSDALALALCGARRIQTDAALSP